MPAKRAGAVFMLAHIEREPGQPHAVKQTLKERRHCRPPQRINDDKMVAPFNRLLQGDEVGLERLYRFVAKVEYRVELHLAQVKAPHLVACRFGGGFVQKRHLAGERRPRVGVAEQKNNLFMFVVAEKAHDVVRRLLLPADARAGPCPRAAAA